ncbi:Phosphate-selective porin O and P [Thiohalospira halophila DSM 15071]|uniref:Phosphate-selective porin O and P n=1 Tax=Thiohalospira halophila DSM 15071 TaxID=1123397 RepID=A0A1I1NWG2_9GAMM|nr:hypothetical protein [Thiohalospira halophila]SFD01939.1 Phosphate-selective porin O and P [Thiohalospira halophila DSM 15071]
MMNRIHARAALAAGLPLAVAAGPATAANWLVLNSAEAPEGAPNMSVFGFIQPTYRNIDDSDKAPNGRRPIFNTLSPDRSSSQGFNLARARLGVRGALNNTDEDIHYFLLTEWGNNGITRLADPDGGSHGPQLTDASLTFRHLAGGGSDDIWEPGVSLRIGQFQWPLVDEGLRAIPTYDYISFSEVSRQQVLERYVRANGDPTNETPNQLSGFDGAISSYRDIGAMAFDEFRITEHWEGTWAAGLGNGNGINRGDNDDNQDVYLRAQAAYVFDGVHRGNPRREDFKVYAWSQQGDRVFDANGDGTLDGGEEFERNRHGLGFHFYRQPWRLSGEYIFGNGMVYNGTNPPFTDPGEDIGDVLPKMAWGEDNEFDGWYLDAAWFVQPNKLALQARYDVLNRLNEFDGDGQFASGGHPERVFETWTLGLQYWVHPIKSQWTLSYRIRDLEAPHNDGADKVGSTMGNEIALQYFHLFNAGG